MKHVVCPAGHGNVRLEVVGYPGQQLMRLHFDDMDRPCPWSEAPLPAGYVPPVSQDVDDVQATDGAPVSEPWHTEADA